MLSHTKFYNVANEGLPIMLSYVYKNNWRKQLKNILAFPSKKNNENENKEKKK